MRQDRDLGIKRGGMAGLGRKKGGKAGFENPYVDPLKLHRSFSLLLFSLITESVPFDYFQMVS